MKRLSLVAQIIRQLVEIEWAIRDSPELNAYTKEIVRTTIRQFIRQLTFGHYRL